MQIGFCHLVHISVFPGQQSNNLASLSFVCILLSLHTQTQMILLIKIDLEVESLFGSLIKHFYHSGAGAAQWSCWKKSFVILYYVVTFEGAIQICGVTQQCCYKSCFHVVSLTFILFFESIKQSKSRCFPLHCAASLSGLCLFSSIPARRSSIVFLPV